MPHTYDDVRDLLSGCIGRGGTYLRLSYDPVTLVYKAKIGLVKSGRAPVSNVESTDLHTCLRTAAQRFDDWLRSS